VKAAALRLLAYCQAHDWAGYDPYDALNSKVYEALPFLHFRAARLALTQLLKRSPVNLRPLLRVPPGPNPKGLALFISAGVRLYRLGLLPAATVTELIGRLAALRSPGSPFWCWGYPFPWQSRGALFPRWVPNVICTSFAGNALLDAYEADLSHPVDPLASPGGEGQGEAARAKGHLNPNPLASPGGEGQGEAAGAKGHLNLNPLASSGGEGQGEAARAKGHLNPNPLASPGGEGQGEEARAKGHLNPNPLASPGGEGQGEEALPLLEMAVSAADFLLRDLYYEEGGSVACFSYMSLARSKVHNASLLGAAFLCRVAQLTGERKYRQPALRAARYAVSHQQEDGSWDYGESDHPPQRWKDSFHTGFNLCALRAIAKNAETSAFEDSLGRGFSFYRQNFFLADGTPKYYHDRTYPIDIHSAAQAIITLLTLKDLDAGNVPLAQAVCRWTLQNLRDAEGGYFYLQKRPLYTNKIPYMRWSQAWMLLALSDLLEVAESTTA